MQINVLEYLESIAATHGDSVAFIENDRTLTFGELRHRAKALCRKWSPFFSAREPVVIFTRKSLETIIAYLAVLYGGGYYIPLDAELPKSRLTNICQRVNAPLLIGFEQDAQNYPDEFRDRVLCFEKSDALPERGPDDRWKTIINTDPMYVIFTSGSTGTPKGVVTSHQAVIDYIEAFSAVSGISREDRLGGQAPLDYVAAIRDIYLPLKTGASTVLLDKRLFSFPGELFDELDRHRVTTLCWVVSALCIPAKMNVLRSRAPAYVNKVIFTGAVMPSKYLAQWQSALPDALYINHYGPTEITASCTYAVMDHPVRDDEVLPIGKPYRNTDIFLLNGQNQLITQANEVGEIYVRGCGLALGYFGDPQKSAETFIQNPAHEHYRDLVYRTGDLAHFDDQGVYWFHGRMDHQIKHMGHRIELSEIEHAASHHPGVEASCCQYDEETQIIWLFYEGEQVSSRELAVALRETLPAFMLPRKLIGMPRLPLRDNGKIDIQALKAQMAEGRSRKKA